MNAADYLYEQLMAAHKRIRELEDNLRYLELNYAHKKIAPVVEPKRGRGRPKKVQS